MKKIVRLKEKDLQRIVKRVLKEQVDELPNDDMDRAFPENSEDNGFSQTTDKRYIRSNYGLTSLPDPTDMSPETAVINLNGNNITNIITNKNSVITNKNTLTNNINSTVSHGDLINLNSDQVIFLN